MKRRYTEEKGDESVEKAIHLAEHKCFDCDEVFLIRFGGQAKLCPRCGSDRIQFWGDTVMVPVEDSKASS